VGRRHSPELGRRGRCGSTRSSPQSYLDSPLVVCPERFARPAGKPQAPAFSLERNIALGSGAGRTSVWDDHYHLVCTTGASTPGPATASKDVRRPGPHSLSASLFCLVPSTVRARRSIYFRHGTDHLPCGRVLVSRPERFEEQSALSVTDVPTPISLGAAVASRRALRQGAELRRAMEPRRSQRG
jgi:hypothetical protein